MKKAFGLRGIASGHRLRRREPRRRQGDEFGLARHGLRTAVRPSRRWPARCGPCGWRRSSRTCSGAPAARRRWRPGARARPPRRARRDPPARPAAHAAPPARRRCAARPRWDRPPAPRPAAASSNSPPAGTSISRYTVGDSAATGDRCPKASPTSTRTRAGPSSACGMAPAGVCVNEGADSSWSARQADPELQPMIEIGLPPQVVGLALRMHDAAPGGHPVDRAGLDQLHAAQAVAMHHRALEQVGDRGQADVRMRPHVVVVAGLHGHRAEMVEEDERPDAAPAEVRQQPPHPEAAAEILLAAHEIRKALSITSLLPPSAAPPRPPAGRTQRRNAGRPPPSRPPRRPSATRTVAPLHTPAQFRSSRRAAFELAGIMPVPTQTPPCCMASVKK